MANQKELQKAFVAYLIQDAQTQGIQIQTEEDLQKYAEQLGEDGIKAKYQEFMSKMQGGMKARLGAKLDYYRKLKGVDSFKKGGKSCKKMEEGNEVTKFKNKRAKMSKCGSKMKK